MILYGKPVADALREKYEERIEAMAWKRTLTVIRDETSDKGYLAAIQREAERWKVNLMYAEDLKQAAQMQGVRVIDLRRNAARKLHGFYAVDGQSDVGREKAYVGEMYADTPLHLRGDHPYAGLLQYPHSGQTCGSNRAI